MTIKQSVRLSRPLVNALLHEAQISSDKTIAGLVTQRESTFRCQPIQAQSDGAGVFFAISAAERRVAIQAAEQQGGQLFAVYQSYPKAPALPAVTDADVAGLPETLYLVISLNTKGVLEMRGFQRQANQLEEVDLMI
ncbi:Mov34/MPN/PAD-1 family protein [Methylophaga frappieri]|uniref:Mov34/MPN/PAD-1 family protein n=1 Tax=Methylophaga frappieri (strain ATCC BAA-2434 / DSM 25690 / JAM7) TaxID=754477 RepID=I1YKF7_METFJ|nr:Mov34/MPN/PAD-1 family protein [Methylophaga frappieri]AFJ03400.1 Mov34/MPN/PAD-1 family protein [Methylophaga frappieri]